MPTNDEMQRILENPDNIIVSDSLYDMLDMSSNNEIEKEAQNTTIVVGKSVYVCSVIKAVKASGAIKFVLLVPTLSLNSFLVFEGPITLAISENRYVQCLDTESEFSESILTISTRRIINETVYV